MAGRPAVFRLDSLSSDDGLDSENEAGWEVVGGPDGPPGPRARWRRLARHILRVWALRRLWGHLGQALRRYKTLR